MLSAKLGLTQESNQEIQLRLKKKKKKSLPLIPPPHNSYPVIMYTGLYR